MALVWEELECVPKSSSDVYPDRMSRARVPGGWLVFIYSISNNAQSVTFYADPEHRWDGGSFGGQP